MCTGPDLGIFTLGIENFVIFYWINCMTFNPPKSTNSNTTTILTRTKLCINKSKKNYIISNLNRTNYVTAIQGIHFVGLYFSLLQVREKCETNSLYLSLSLCAFKWRVRVGVVLPMFRSLSPATMTRDWLLHFDAEESIWIATKRPNKLP